MLQPGTPVVLAGNFAQFRKWCEDHRIQLSNAVFITEPNQLVDAQLEASQIVRVGTYWERPDYAAVEEMIDKALTWRG